MPLETLKLPADPAAAVDLLLEASRRAPTFLFKKSPRCPISFAAEDEWREFLRDHAQSTLAIAEVDVVAQRDLARGITAILHIGHESPQAVHLRAGEVLWHDSHDRLTADAFAHELSRD
jgi:bacillithiol system protein YtxJ